ncbi:MAG: c-type cytochrome [Balneolales bacterium]
MTASIWIEQDDQARITGEVRDAITEEILPGRTVMIEGPALVSSENSRIKGTTNEDGIFTFNVPPGKYNLISQAEGFEEEQFQIEVTSGEELNQDFNLQSATQNYAYSVETMELPQHMVPEVSGVDFTPNGEMVVVNRRGEVWIRSADGEDWDRFAHGLYEPFGVVADVPNGDIFVIQRPEITRLSDLDRDGKADLYETVNDSWGITGNYHEFSYGLARDSQGNLYGGLGFVSAGEFPWTRGELKPDRVVPWTGEGRVPDGHRSVVPYQGWAFRVTPEGEFEPLATGLRQPLGIGINSKDELFITDVSGAWVPSSVLLHVEEGKFYGHPEGLKWDPTYNTKEITTEDLKEMRTPPTVYLPRGPMGTSPGQPVWDVTDGEFGPFSDQMFLGDVSKLLMRVDLEKVDGIYQGAAFPFLRDQGLRQGSMHNAFGPDGNLYLAQTVRGWMPTEGDEGIQRVVWTGENPVDILSMDLTDTGFSLSFTEALLPEKLADVSNYKITRFQYNYHILNGSLRVNEVEVPVEKAISSEEGTSVDLELLELLPGYIYELQMEELESQSGRLMLNTTAYYTANRLLSGETYIADTVLEAEPTIDNGMANAVRGGETYQQYCTVCHQADGRGSSQLGTPDFTSISGPLSMSEDELISTISEGKGYNMPSFGNVISNQEIRDVVAYLRETFKEK